MKELTINAWTLFKNNLVIIHTLLITQGYHSLVMGLSTHAWEFTIHVRVTKTNHWTYN